MAVKRVTWGTLTPPSTATTILKRCRSLSRQSELIQRRVPRVTVFNEGGFLDMSLPRIDHVKQVNIHTRIILRKSRQSAEWVRSPVEEWGQGEVGDGRGAENSRDAIVLPSPLPFRFPTTETMTLPCVLSPRWPTLYHHFRKASATVIGEWDALEHSRLLTSWTRGLRPAMVLVLKFTARWSLE